MHRARRLAVSREKVLAGGGEPCRCGHSGRRQHLPAVAYLPSTLCQTYPKLSACENTYKYNQIFKTGGEQM